MAGCVFLQFFTRYVLNDCYAWTEEIAVYCLIGVVFLGSVDVRARLAPYPGGLPLPLPAANRRPRAVDASIDVVRIGFFGYAAMADVALHRRSSATSG